MPDKQPADSPFTPIIERIEKLESGAECNIHLREDLRHRVDELERLLYDYKPKTVDDRNP